MFENKKIVLQTLKHYHMSNESVVGYVGRTQPISSDARVINVQLTLFIGTNDAAL